MLRNIKHQSHCKELERIRERGREMREKKQADWEERRRVRMEREKELGEKGGKEKFAGEGFSKGPEEDEESSSEDEEWCGGIPAFKGTPSVVIVESNEAVEDSLISDDEENENIEEDTHYSEAVTEEKGGGDNLKKGHPCKQVINSGGKSNQEAEDNKTNEAVHEEGLEEGLNKAVQGAQLSPDNESDVEDVKSDLEGSSDEAPEEIKIVKCYENEEGPCEADVQSQSKTPESDEKWKPSRKRKRKAKKSGAANESETGVAHEEEPGRMPGKKEKAAEPTEKVAKVTRQSVLEQRIRPPTLLERLLLQVALNSCFGTFSYFDRFKLCIFLPGDQEGEEHNPAVCQIRLQKQFF